MTLSIKLETQISSSFILVTGDVTSLYTNVHTAITRKLLAHTFRQYPDNTRPYEILLKLLELALNYNDHSVDSESFLQILGMAMGKPYAPGLANIYVA